MDNDNQNIFYQKFQTLLSETHALKALNLLKKTPDYDVNYINPEDWQKCSIIYFINKYSMDTKYYDEFIKIFLLRGGRSNYSYTQIRANETPALHTRQENLLYLLITNNKIELSSFIYKEITKKFNYLHKSIFLNKDLLLMLKNKKKTSTNDYSNALSEFNKYLTVKSNNNSENNEAILNFDKPHIEYGKKITKLYNTLTPILEKIIEDRTDNLKDFIKYNNFIIEANSYKKAEWNVFNAASYYIQDVALLQSVDLVVAQEAMANQLNLILNIQKFIKEFKETISLIDLKDNKENKKIKNKTIKNIININQDIIKIIEEMNKTDGQNYALFNNYYLNNFKKDSVSPLKTIFYNLSELNLSTVEEKDIILSSFNQNKKFNKVMEFLFKNKIFSPLNNFTDLLKQEDTQSLVLNGTIDVILKYIKHIDVEEIKTLIKYTINLYMEHQDKNAKFKLLKENMEFFKYMLENYKKEFIGEYINLLSTATNNYYTATMHAFIDFMFKNNIESEVLGQDFIEIKTDNNDETNSDRKELLRPMTAICKLVEPYYVLKYMVTTYSDKIANLGRDTLQKNIYDLKIYHKSLKDKDDKNGLGEIINQLENMLLKYKLDSNLPTKTHPNEDKVRKI